MATRFILIASCSDKRMEKILMRSGKPFKILPQKKPEGVAEAIWLARHFVDNEFIVVLGDCLMEGEFSAFRFPGVGVWVGANEYAVRSNYGVKIKRGKVIYLEEKPGNPEEFFCGMGVYFLRRDIFFLMEKKKKSQSLSEFTSLLDEYRRINALFPVHFKGVYFNINTPFDLQLARRHYAGCA